MFGVAAQTSEPLTTTQRRLGMRVTGPVHACGGSPIVSQGHGERQTDLQARSYSGFPNAGVSTLSIAVIAKFRQRATNPALQPKKGSRCVSMRKATVATPANMPANTPRMVTRFQ